MDMIVLIKEIIETIEKNENYLTELDRVIGDSDHGTNLLRGFNKIKEELPNLTGLNNAELFNKIAMLLISNVGGASGALYGTGILRMGNTMKDKSDLKIEDWILALDAMIEGIKMRGKSNLEEKTMLDTIIPAVETLKVNKDDKDIKEIALKVSKSAEDGMNSTKNMVATKGRASYLGERSIGHLDPGAASSYLIIKTVCDIVGRK